MDPWRKPVIGAMIAIPTSVLLVLFLPVFLPHGCPSNTSTCLWHLKQCAAALMLYCDDHDSALPSSRLVNYSKSWNRQDSSAFCTGVGYPATPGSVQNGTWPTLLRYHMKSPDIPLCPSDTRVVDPGPGTPCSYWYKLANDKAWYGNGCGAPRRSVRDYHFQSRQIAFYEHCGWHSSSTGRGLIEGVQTNVVCLDGHVTTITLSNATTGDPINCAANSDGEPMYYNTQVRNGTPRKQTGPAKLADPTFCYDQL